MIRFPKMHIAQSVVNRILNVADGINASRPSNVDRAPGSPEVATESVVLDQNLNAPTPPVTADDDVAQAIALKGLA